MTLYIFAFIGLIIHWAFLLNSARTKPGFSWKIFFDKNWLAMFVQSFITVLCLYDKRITDFIEFDVTTPTSAFLVGFNASVIWNIIKKIVIKKA